MKFLFVQLIEIVVLAQGMLLNVCYKLQRTSLFLMKNAYEETMRLSIALHLLLFKVHLPMLKAVFRQAFSIK